MTRDQLLACTRKELADIARAHGVAGWHDLRKEDLVGALQKSFRRHARRKGGKPPLVALSQGGAAREAPVGLGPPLGQFQVLSSPVPPDLAGLHAKDRVVLVVRDPYWLHCCWELAAQALARAQAALGTDWHGARPILRLYDVTRDNASTGAERFVRDIGIHGGSNHWYIDVASPPRSFRVDLGYLARTGNFYCLARSNPVSTPRPGIDDGADGNWDDIDASKADRLHAQSSGFDPRAASPEVRQFFEERLRQPLGAPMVAGLGGGKILPLGQRLDFGFDIDADLVVHGRTEPNSRVRLQDRPVSLRPDGTFTVRFKLPDSRQVIPCVATSPDGGEERLIVLAIERHTRRMDPAPADPDE